MITVNLFGGFTHLHKQHGIYSMTDNRIPKYWKWVRDKMIHDGITIFTDDYMCNSLLVNSVISKYKVGMMIEPPQINPAVYNKLDEIVNNFDFILTYNKNLVAQYPTKLKYYPFGGSWILDQYVGIYEKTKDVCILYSHKQITDGHRLRHQIDNKFTHIDGYGTGCDRPFEYKEEVIAPYRYTIVVENCKIDDYFSEKLLDAIAVGTIPIYWGTNNIGNYFDEKGIIQFNTIDELEKILPTLTTELYNSKLQYIQNNIEILKKYWCQEDWIYENIFSYLDVNMTHEIVDYKPSDPRTTVDGYSQEHWLNTFFQSGGDDILYNLDLSDTSVVFDMGSYEGEYYSKIYNKYQSIIHTFEPVTEFAKNLPIVPKLHVNTFALGINDGTFEISLNGNSSSAFTSGTKTTCIKKKFIDYINEHNIDHIDLMKINIEGGEYELLNSIIQSNWMHKIDNYLIQFHYLVNDSIRERQKIIDKLKETHNPTFYYPFVWEYWTKK